MNMNKEKFAYHFGRFTKWFSEAMVILVALALVFFGIQLYQNNKLLLKITKSNETKLDKAIPNVFPLKFDTPQKVLREPPVFHLNEPVDVEARFFNETNEPITLSADVHWVLVSQDPDMGTVEPVQVGLFITLKPGCTKIPFSNNRPDAVASLTQKLFDSGHIKVTWRLTGFNQIIAPNFGGKQRFDVSEFSYVPDSTPIPANQIKHIPDSCEKL